MATLSLGDQAAFADDLATSARRAASAAQMYTAMNQQLPPQCTVTLYTNMYKPAGEVGDYIEVTCDFVRNQIETATIVLKATDPMVPVAMACYQTVVPVTIDVGNLRWSGRVDNFDYALVNGVRTLTLQCMGDYAWFSKILVWPNFLLPIQTQFPTKALYIGPAITCIKTMIMEQAFRIQTGLWEFVNTLLSGDLDWNAWFGTFKQAHDDNLDVLTTPLAVVGTNPLLDTSPWISINGRMDQISTLVEEAVKANGLVLTANLWLPGDPQPGGLIHDLTNPTIVVDCVDRSGLTGPTGTFVDGIVKDLVDLQASAFGEALAPFLNPNNNYAPEGVNLAPVFGVDFVKPWALFHDHPRGGLTEFHLMGHHPLAYTVIGGGKSPKWINDLINISFEWLIDAITIAIGITGVASDLLDGTLDDVLLAFQLIENAERRQKLGPYGWPEFFIQTGSSAYTLDEWFALMGAMWDTRGYHCIKLSFDNGFPYSLGKDLFVGSLASFALNNNLYTDYVEKATFKDDRKSRARINILIGDGKRADNPITKTIHRVVKLEEALQIITLSSN